MDLDTRCHAAGREHLGDLTGPALFAAHHDSRMDTPLTLRTLPRRRRRTAVAAAADVFHDTRGNAPSRSPAFGAVPLDRNGGVGEPHAEHTHQRRPA